MANELDPKVPKLYNDHTLSYSETSFDSGTLPTPSNGVATKPRR